MVNKKAGSAIRQPGHPSTPSGPEALPHMLRTAKQTCGAPQALLCEAKHAGRPYVPVGLPLSSAPSLSRRFADHTTILPDSTGCCQGGARRKRCLIAPSGPGGPSDTRTPRRPRRGRPRSSGRPAGRDCGSSRSRCPGRAPRPGRRPGGGGPWRRTRRR